jgi:hypothetical protein
MVHTSLKNGRGQMTQTNAGVNIARKEKDGRRDPVMECQREHYKKNSGWTEDDDVWELGNVSDINKLLKCVCVYTHIHNTERQTQRDKTLQ